MNSPVPFRIILLPPYPRSPFLVPFCLKARCLRRGWGWKVFARFRGTESLWYSKWCGTDRDGTDSSQSTVLTGGRWYFSLFQSKSEAGSGHAKFLVCQKKESPPSAPSALSQANFRGGSSTSGSRHLFFNGAGLKLGSLHLFFSDASPKSGALCTFSSTVQAPRWVLWLPELWACKSVEE